MKKLSALITWLQSLERSEQTYWLGMIMLFVGLTWSVSVFVALIIVGAGIAVESVITSYLALWFGSRIK